MTPNDSLSVAKFDINWDEFNLPARDAEIIPLDDTSSYNVASKFTK